MSEVPLYMLLSAARGAPRDRRATRLSTPPSLQSVVPTPETSTPIPTQHVVRYHCAWYDCDQLYIQMEVAQTLNPRPETLNPRPETRDPRPETRNSKPYALDPQP